MTILKADNNPYTFVIIQKMFLFLHSWHLLCLYNVVHTPLIFS